MMNINFDAVLIDSDVLRVSIHGVKNELYRWRSNLNHFKEAKRTTALLNDTFVYHSKGAVMARKVMRLEAIIKELEALLKLSEYNQLKQELLNSK
jgi:hypothetical protein